MASAVCKTLYENSVAIKGKHQALLKRLPSSPSSSPSPEPPSRASSRYSISLSRPVSEYDASPLTYKSQARKISFSTLEISHLADQNAELLDKLERVETEAVQADQTGRRELKRLEKEILNLREELEKTQAKSEELEEKTKAGFAWDTEKVVQEVWKKKEEREAKFRAMRNVSQGSAMHTEGGYQVRNFAPEGSGFGMSTSAVSHLPPRHASAAPFSHTQPSSGTHPEYSLIAQLLQKIQELEQTNTRIIEQQTETTNQLNAMQRETEQITKIYECFADEDIIEVTPDTGSENEDLAQTSNDDTIQFRSLKRNLVALLPDSPNKDKLLQSLTKSTVSHARKSVFGLFDAADEDPHDNLTPGKLFSSHLPGSGRNSGHRSSQSIGSTGLVSPAFSPHSLPSSQSQPSSLYDSCRPRTLEAELGNDLTDLGLNSSNLHLRDTSLYQLSQISVPSSPSLSPVSLDRSRSGGRDTFLPTPTSAGTATLRLSLEPPTPEKSGIAARGDKGLSGRQSLRLHRMSETVRSRTDRWVDGRFKDTLRGSRKINTFVDQGNHPEEIARPLTPLSLHLTSAFENAVLNVKGEADSPVSERGDGDVDSEEPESQLVIDRRRPGLGNTMLQVWLWLQFAMVIFIFVWSMARRGPQSVLGKPGQRRVASSSR